MARIDFGDGEGLERIRMWSLQPEDPSRYIHG